MANLDLNALILSPIAVSALLLRSFRSQHHFLASRPSNETSFVSRRSLLYQGMAFHINNKTALGSEQRSLLLPKDGNWPKFATDQEGFTLELTYLDFAI